MKATIVLLLLLSLCLGKTALKPCRSNKYCYKCLKDPSCGWCQNECMEGTEQGPLNNYCKYSWSYKTCSQELCGLYVDCISCL